MKLTICFTLSKDRIPLECEPETTATELKRRIFTISEGKNKIEPEKLHLVYSGEKIEGETTLKEKGVKEGDILYIIQKFVQNEREIKEKGKLYITVNLPSGEQKRYVLPESATIEDLKTKIHEIEGIEVNQQRLMLNGRQVHVGFLSSFAKRAEITFNLRLRCVLDLRLMNSDGDEFVYHIPDTALVHKVRAVIAKHEDIKSEIDLVFNGQVLEDNMTLGDYEAIEKEKGTMAIRSTTSRKQVYRKKECCSSGHKNYINVQPMELMAKGTEKPTKKSFLAYIVGKCFGFNR